MELPNYLLEITGVVTASNWCYFDAYFDACVGKSEQRFDLEDTKRTKCSFRH